MYNSFHSGSNSSGGWYLSFWRRQAAISAETAITHSDDRTRDGRITIRTLRQRCASSLKRKAINSNSTNTICGCLLRAQRVTQTERSQSRPAVTAKDASLVEVLADDLLFDFNKAVLKPAADRALEQAWTK